MYAAPRGEYTAGWVGRVTGIVNVCMISSISVLVVVDIFASDDIDLVQDDTAIPRWVYLTLLFVLFASSIMWMLSEWYMERWERFKSIYNLGCFYIVMTITTFVLLMLHLLNGRALFDFMPMIPIFYVPYGAIYMAWVYTTTPEIREDVHRTFYNLASRIRRT